MCGSTSPDPVNVTFNLTTFNLHYLCRLHHFSYRFHKKNCRSTEREALYNNATLHSLTSGQQYYGCACKKLHTASLIMHISKSAILCYQYFKFLSGIVDVNL